MNVCFHGCSSLTTAPELSKFPTKDYHYEMFKDCTNLNYVKVRFTNWNSTESSTSNWLYNVSPTGTFVCPEDLDTTQRGPDYIPEGWDIIKY